MIRTQLRGAYAEGFVTVEVKLLTIVMDKVMEISPCDPLPLVRPQPLYLYIWVSAFCAIKHANDVCHNGQGFFLDPIKRKSGSKCTHFSCLWKKQLRVVWQLTSSSWRCSLFQGQGLMSVSVWTLEYVGREATFSYSLHTFCARRCSYLHVFVFLRVV